MKKSILVSNVKKIVIVTGILSGLANAQASNVCVAQYEEDYGTQAYYFQANCNNNQTFSTSEKSSILGSLLYNNQKNELLNDLQPLNVREVANIMLKATNDTYPWIIFVDSSETELKYCLTYLSNPREDSINQDKQVFDVTLNCSDGSSMDRTGLSEEEIGQLVQINNMNPVPILRNGAFAFYTQAVSSQ